MSPATVRRLAAATAIGFATVLLGVMACSGGGAAIQAVRDSLRQVDAERTLSQTHLTRFDTLDFDVFSNQKWDRLSESHASDILVHWPDGHTTTGIAKHIEDLKAMFVYAPDTRIAEHPIRIASGEWTAVSGIMTGTFSRPMPMANGRSIPPTNKHFSLPMATIGRWRNGVMVEEYLYWDNQTYLRQIGLAP